MMTPTRHRIDVGIGGGVVNEPVERGRERLELPCCEPGDVEPATPSQFDSDKETGAQVADMFHRCVQPDPCAASAGSRWAEATAAIIAMVVTGHEAAVDEAVNAAIGESSRQAPDASDIGTGREEADEVPAMNRMVIIDFVDEAQADAISKWHGRGVGAHGDTVAVAEPLVTF